MGIQTTTKRRVMAGFSAAGLASLALVGVMVQPAAAADFSAGTPLGAIPDGGAPVSKSIVVTGLQSSITDVNVVIGGITHNFADDLDILVQGPDGTAVMLLSDARGSDDFANTTLGFDSTHIVVGDTDFGPFSSLQDTTQNSGISSSYYGPSDYATSTTGAETVAPFTDGTTSTDLGSFNGKNPNGTWKVFVEDDDPTGTGSIAGPITLSVEATTPTPPTPPTPTTCLGKTATIVGTAGNDAPVGTKGKDIVSLGAGDDTFNGKAGNDIVCGGDGNDTLKGGLGNDKLYGEAGNDVLKGGLARDRCDGGPGTDTTSRTCERKLNIP